MLFACANLLLILYRYLIGLSDDPEFLLCVTPSFAVIHISIYIWPAEVRLRATKSREICTAAGREIRTTAARTRRENGNDTTTNSISSCGGKTRPNGGRATARTEPRKRAIIMAILTVLTGQTKWERRTGRTWATERNASETRWARRWAWDWAGRCFQMSLVMLNACEEIAVEHK